jgi:hypothetical protein
MQQNGNDKVPLCQKKKSMHGHFPEVESVSDNRHQHAKDNPSMHIGKVTAD